MRKRRLAWILLLAALLLPPACGALETEAETEPYSEPYHLREPIDEALYPRVEGIKACFDAWKELDGFPLAGEAYFYISHSSSASDPGQIDLLAYDDAGNGLVMLSQFPQLDGYELYACSHGTYDTRNEVYAAIKAGMGFFYELEGGLVIPALMDGEENPEYAVLHEQWVEMKNGG